MDNENFKPIFQGVMVGIFGQQGFAFTTEGVVISNKKEKWDSSKELKKQINKLDIKPDDLDFSNT
ncbi:DUF3124 domain-containing protein [Aquimarina longa]|uniref:DUF3124 domain-containing protein n=1 Tax=Aquimarina longa TaxID=1080221 RepID=UPI000781E437|nr:DUF3124 domain-containing protein [Aquimarina longa]